MELLADSVALPTDSAVLPVDSLVCLLGLALFLVDLEALQAGLLVFGMAVEDVLLHSGQQTESVLSWLALLGLVMAVKGLIASAAPLVVLAVWVAVGAVHAVLLARCVVQSADLKATMKPVPPQAVKLAVPELVRQESEQAWLSKLTLMSVDQPVWVGSCVLSATVWLEEPIRHRLFVLESELAQLVVANR